MSNSPDGFPDIKSTPAPDVAGGQSFNDTTRIVRTVPSTLDPFTPHLVGTPSRYNTTTLVDQQTLTELPQQAEVTPPTRFQRVRRFAGRVATRLGIRRDITPEHEQTTMSAEYITNVAIQERFKHNQDTFLDCGDTLAVYDGAGGAGGDPAAAANAARQATLDVLSATVKPQTVDDARRIHADMFAEMRAAVAQTDGSTTAAVATVVESPLTGDRHVVYRVAGDSRIAILRANGKVEFLGRDQSDVHPDGPVNVYRMLTNAISTTYDGKTEDPNTGQMADDFGSERLEPGDRLLLATDGLFGDDRRVGEGGKTEYIDEEEFGEIYDANKEKDANGLCGVFAGASRKLKDDMTILCADVNALKRQNRAERRQTQKEQAVQQRKRRIVRAVGVAAGAATLTGLAIAANYFGVMNSLDSSDRDYPTPTIPPQVAAPILPGAIEQALPPTVTPDTTTTNYVMPSGNKLEITRNTDGDPVVAVIEMGPNSNPYQMSADVNRVVLSRVATPEEITADNPFAKAPLSKEATNLSNARISYKVDKDGQPKFESVVYNAPSLVE